MTVVEMLRTAGIVANNPSRWQSWMPYPLRFRYLHTESQIFDAIRENSVDVLALELTWFEDLTWLPAILEQASSAQISVVFLLGSAPWVVRVTSRPETAGLARPWSGNCTTVDIDRRQVFHSATPLTVPWRVTQLLFLMTSEPGLMWDSRQATRLAAQRHWAPWSENLLKVHVHLIRQVLDPRHLITVAAQGYRFMPCGSVKSFL